MNFSKKTTPPTPLHSTHLFKIFFSLLTLSTAFLQKACEPGKNCKKDKNYKLSIYRYNQSVMNDITRYWIEKFNLGDISGIDNIDKPNLKNFKHLKETSFYKELGSRRDIGYEADDLENIDIIPGGSIQSGGSLKIIQNTRFVVKISECSLFTEGDSLEITKVPELFFKKRNLIIIKI